MLLVANLDCERTWAGLPPEPALLARLTELGALLALLGAPGDVVWTRAPLVEHDLAPALQSCVAGFVSGTLPDAATDGALVWGVTEEVAHLLAVAHSRGTPACVPDAAAQANDRRLTVSLPGACVVRSDDELFAHVRHGGAAASPEGRWVVKAPHGTAGRERLRGTGAELTVGERTRLVRLLAAHGALVFEPWVDVLDEWGVAATVAAEGAVEIVGAHRQVVAGGGAVRSLRPCDRDVGAAVDHAAEALRAVGYVGPFGIDGYRYRDASGAVRTQPVGEINARVTFGALAHAAVRRLGRDGQALHLGTRADLERAGPDAVPLLLGTGPAGVAAWVE